MTSERLAKALEAANAPKAMITAARAGCYDDYKSESAFPLTDLVRDLTAATKGLANHPRAVLLALAQRVRNGDFDATAEESEEWAASQTGEMAEVLKTLGRKV